MYLDEYLSAKQIAEKLGISKSTALKQIHKSGLKKSPKKGCMTDPKNYRFHTAPYGFSIKGGRLVPNTAELRICRRVVNLIRKGLTYRAVSFELANLGFKNREKKVFWDHSTVIRIYKRWNEKL